MVLRRADIFLRSLSSVRESISSTSPHVAALPAFFAKRGNSVRTRNQSSSAGPTLVPSLALRIWSPIRASFVRDAMSAPRRLKCFRFHV